MQTPSPNVTQTDSHAAWSLWLLRHGTPAETGALLGWTDCSLASSGMEEAQVQGERLAGHGIRKIISSDLQRCQTTARHLTGLLAAADERSPEVTVTPDWRELNFGAWDGLSLQNIATSALWSFYADPDQSPPPDGERWGELRGRVAHALATLAPEPTLVIAHGGSIRAALSVLLGWSLHQCWAIDIPYAALLRLTVWETKPRTAQLTGLFRVEDGQ